MKLGVNVWSEAGLHLFMILSMGLFAILPTSPWYIAGSELCVVLPFRGPYRLGLTDLQADYCSLIYSSCPTLQTPVAFPASAVWQMHTPVRGNRMYLHVIAGILQLYVCVCILYMARS